MCCRHRRRGPLIVVLGKLAYDKYQSNKAEKRERSLSDPNNAMIERSSLSEKANNEILEKAGIEPPSYDELVVNRTIVPPEPNAVDKKSGWFMLDGEENLRDDLSDTESFIDVVDGMRPNPHMETATSSFIAAYRPQEAERKMSKCEQKREAKKARKAAKAYERARKDMIKESMKIRSQQ